MRTFRARDQGGIESRTCSGMLHHPKPERMRISDGAGYQEGECGEEAIPIPGNVVGQEAGLQAPRQEGEDVLTHSPVIRVGESPFWPHRIGKVVKDRKGRRPLGR